MTVAVAFANASPIVANAPANVSDHVAIFYVNWASSAGNAHMVVVMTCTMWQRKECVIVIVVISTKVKWLQIEFVVIAVTAL